MRTCYSLRGRTLFIEFKCGRCGTTYFEPYEKQAANTEGNLQCFKPPEGWQDDGLYNPLLCPECAEQFHRFLRNEGDVVHFKIKKDTEVKNGSTT